MSNQRQQRGPAWLEDYVGADEKVTAFRKAHPKARVLTQIVPEREPLTMRAEIYLEENETTIPNATAHASVDGGSGNRGQSPVEKTETAAISRALWVLGFGGETEREEAQRAERPQAPVRQPVPDKMLDREIMAALEVLGYTEDQLNKTVAKDYGHRGDWTELAVDKKREVLGRLNNLANEKAA